MKQRQNTGKIGVFRSGVITKNERHHTSRKSTKYDRSELSG